MRIMDSLQVTCHVPPLLIISGYLAYPKHLRIDPSLLYGISVLHNCGLIGFSVWTFTALSHIIYTDGFVFQSNYYFQNQAFDQVIYLFYLSKYYEFFDTFLLYLNGKTPSFLQKYHHIGAVLSWHLMYVYKVDGIWMPTLLNALVHAIMYSYYLGCLLKIKRIRVIKRYITSIQLCQFAASYVLLYVYNPPVETRFNYGILLFFASYGIGLIGLFGKFYRDTYYLKLK